MSRFIQLVGFVLITICIFSLFYIKDIRKEFLGNKVPAQHLFGVILFVGYFGYKVVDIGIIREEKELQDKIRDYNKERKSS